MDKDTRAAGAFYRAVRRFSENANPWDTNTVYHDVTPDEQYDLTLISYRVYGRRDEYLTVMACAGLDTVDQKIPQKKLVLPSEATLYALKRETGFESLSSLREDFAPTWAED